MGVQNFSNNFETVPWNRLILECSIPMDKPEQRLKWYLDYWTEINQSGANGLE